MSYRPLDWWLGLGVYIVGALVVLSVMVGIAEMVAQSHVHQ
jgi:hypothetical protein